ncbi:MAG: carbohydrate ABC transporter permease [Oscillospiraceae bacterium]|nr:carbohydrate ABC transporter permease [Oscillospiraceae bacterium]
MKNLKSFLRYVFLITVSFFSVFPLYWMAISATNKNVDVIRGTLMPGTYLVENFKTLIDQQNLGGALVNSFRNSIVLTVISLLICSLAGYGFEIYHSKAKDRFMGVLLLAMMIPFAAIMIPLFTMFANMKLLNTTIGFILPTIATPFLIMLFRQSARSFPRDIIEAARIDGLNELQIFFRMFIPTMKSTYAAAMTITFMAAWNNFLWPRIIMLSNDAVTMPMLVSNIIQGYVTDNGMLMLAVLITTIPTVIIFFILQKNFAEGITGAVK